MTAQDTTLAKACFMHFRRELLLGMQSLHSFISFKEVMNIKPPPLRFKSYLPNVKTRINKISMDDVLINYHKIKKLDEELLLDVWQKACPLALDDTQESRIALFAELHRAMPWASFDPYNRHLNMIKFLAIVRGSQVRFKAITHTLSAKLAGQTCLVDSVGIEWAGQRKRFKHMLTMPINNVLSTPIGAGKSADAKLVGLYTHLYNALPQYQPMYMPLFSVILHGDDAAAVLDMFDIVATTTYEPQGLSAFKAARKIVKSATKWPTEELEATLGHLAGPEGIMAELGVRPAEMFSKRRREEILIAIDDLKARVHHRIQAPVADVKSLLALQQLVKGSHGPV